MRMIQADSLSKPVSKCPEVGLANSAESPPLFLWGSIAIVVCGLVSLHFYRFVHAGALWRDELSSLYVATSPTLRDLYANQAYDSFPLLNAVLLRVWLAIAGFPDGLPVVNEYYARVYGLMGGLFLLGALLYVAILVFNTRPVFSLGLFAASPVVIVWGDSLRAYALGTGLAILFFGSMWKWLESPSRRQVTITTLLAVAMVWTLYGNAFFVLAITIAAATQPILQRDWRKFAATLIPGAVAAASLLLNWPVIRFMATWRESVAQHVSAAAIASLWWTAWTAPGVWAGFVWVLCLMVVIGLLGAVVVRDRDRLIHARQNSLALYCLLTIVVGLVTFCGYLKTVDVPPMVWYFIPISAILAAGMDAAWKVLPRGKALLSCQIFLLFSLAVATSMNSLPVLQERMTNVDTFAMLLEKNATEKDLVIFNPMQHVSTLLRHYRGAAAVQCWPPHRRDQLTFQRNDVALEATYQPTSPMMPLFEQIRSTLQAGGRVWMAGSVFPVPLDKPPPTIPQGTVFTDRWQLGPYLYVWGAQTFHYLGSHAVSGKIAELPADLPCSPLEQVKTIILWEGWRPDSQDQGGSSGVSPSQSPAASQ